MELLLSNRPEASVQALTYIDCCIFDRRAISDYVRVCPALGMALSERLRRDNAAMEDRMVDLLGHSSQEQVARLIYELVGRARETAGPRTVGIFFPLRQRHIADALGLSPEYVSRILSRLRAQRVVEIENRTLRVMDEGALAAIAESAGAAADAGRSAD
jgi:CRP-like cAMP-binding protein